MLSCQLITAESLRRLSPRCLLWTFKEDRTSTRFSSSQSSREGLSHFWMTIALKKNFLTPSFTSSTSISWHHPNLLQLTPLQCLLLHWIETLPLAKSITIYPSHHLRLKLTNNSCQRSLRRLILSVKEEAKTRCHNQNLSRPIRSTWSIIYWQSKHRRLLIPHLRMCSIRIILPRRQLTRQPSLSQVKTISRNFMEEEMLLHLPQDSRIITRTSRELRWLKTLGRSRRNTKGIMLQSGVQRMLGRGEKFNRSLYWHRRAERSKSGIMPLQEMSLMIRLRKREI